jgi:hypothetical protein
MNDSVCCIFWPIYYQASPPTVEVVEGVPSNASASGLVVAPTLTCDTRGPA